MTGSAHSVIGSKMSLELSLRNVRISEKSVSFDWTDPDGDENHWKLELTAIGNKDCYLNAEHNPEFLWFILHATNNTQGFAAEELECHCSEHKHCSVACAGAELVPPNDGLQTTPCPSGLVQVLVNALTGD